jgi:2-(1,2-epoxy-1,2-dihydrophenyl)acetyl-CoA isomerase
MISQDFYVDLACDYSIVADNTVIHKPYLELGLVPKGGGAYFLKKKLGHSIAYRVLLSQKAITADEALELGIVDEVVPYDDLENAALRTAELFTQSPATSLSRTKKLLNYSWKDLAENLENENFELWDIIRRLPMFKEAADRNFLQVGGSKR